MVGRDKHRIELNNTFVFDRLTQCKDNSVIMVFVTRKEQTADVLEFPRQLIGILKECLCGLSLFRWEKILNVFLELGCLSDDLKK